MIARDAELEALAAALGRTAAGAGGVVLVAGEAGIGKTSLVRAAMAASVLRGVCAEISSTSTPPYAPVVAVLRQLLRSDPSLLDRAGALGSPLQALLAEPDASSPGLETVPVAETVPAVLSAASRDMPTVVFLDDLQWADAATLELLPRLAAWAEDEPLLVIAAYRSDEIPRTHPLRRVRTDLRRGGRLREIVVGPLDPGGVAALAAGMLDDALSADLTALLHDRTQGVPFLVEELVRALCAAGSLVPSPAGVVLQRDALLPLPETVRDVVRMRLTALTEEAIRTLQAAAATGRQTELGLLAAIGEDRGVDEAIEHGILLAADQGTVAFRHDLHRESVYADIPWPRRRALHTRLAEVLPGRSHLPPRLLADHWLAAGEPQRARPLLVEAADAAARAHAHRDAVTALDAALELWPGHELPVERRAALRDLAWSAQRCGDLARSAQAWEELLDCLPPSESLDIAEASAALASVYELLHGFEKAVRMRVDAAQRFRDAGDAEAAGSQRLVAAWRVAPRDAAGASELIEQALAEALQARSERLEIRCLSLRAFLCGLDGASEAASATVEDSLRRALAGGHIDEAVEAQWVLGTLANHWGDYRTAESAFGSAVEACRAHAIDRREATCRACLGITLFNSGEWDRAVEIGRDVLACGAGPEAREHALLVLGLVDAARGSRRRARSRLTEAAAMGRGPRPEGSTVLQSLGGLALLDELEGEDDGRWRQLVDREPGALRQNYVLWVRRATTFAVKHGDRDLAKRSADLLGAWTARFGTTDAVASFAHALAEIALLEGDGDTAVQQFSRAVELLEAMGAPFELAWTRTRAATACEVSGDRPAAVEHLVAAHRTFRRLRAQPFVQEVAAQLRTMGEPVDRRVGRRTAGSLDRGGLTQRELEVLQFVAEGRTNREIAEELVLSTRTIDMHVRNILMKLGARSRTEAVARAASLRLLRRGG